MARTQFRSIPGVPDEVANRGDLVNREEALAILGIKRESLYCYVSRGLIRSVPHPDAHTSLYVREDVARVKAKSMARSGHGPAAASAMRWGEPVISTSITDISEKGPLYRSRLAVELARSGYGFETVAEFLWGGELSDEPLAWQRVAPPTALPQLVDQGMALHSRPRLLQALTLTTTALGMAEGSRRERILGGSSPVQAARRLIRTLTGVLGLLGPSRAYVDLADGEAVAVGLLRALGVHAGEGEVHTLNAALIVVADHELDPATFAARISASTSADIHCCIGAALNTHQGTLTGRACDRLERLFSIPVDSERVLSEVRETLDAGRTLPGFNHYLYPHGDPRAAILIELAQELGSRNIVVRHMCDALSRMESDFNLRPSVECGLVILARAMDLPEQLAGGIFALGRCAGWVAHVMEQRLAGFLIRPRARFVGTPEPL